MQWSMDKNNWEQTNSKTSFYISTYPHSAYGMESVAATEDKELI